MSVLLLLLLLLLLYYGAHQTATLNADWLHFHNLDDM